MKGVRLQRDCEDAYLNDPTSLVKLLNHVLHLHVFAHDVPRCRVLYDRAMEGMKRRGPDNGFLLFNYAIFQVGWVLGGRVVWGEGWSSLRRNNAALLARLLARH